MRLQAGAQQVDIAADAAAEDDQLGVEDRGDAADDERQSLGLGVDGLQRQLVARARGVEHLLRGQPAARLHAEPLRRPHDRGRRRGLLEDPAQRRAAVAGRRADRQVGDLAGRSVRAAVELAAEDHAHADAGAEHQVGERLDVAAAPVGELAERGEVRVVVEVDARPERLAESVRQAGTAPAGQVRRVAQAPVAGVEDARAADDDVHDAAPAQAGGLRHGARLDAHGVDERGRRAGAVALVLARDDRPAQVGGRDADELAPDVDAEHVAGRRVGLVEDGRAPARGGGAADLADEPGALEVGECLRDGRLRQARLARELRA